MRCILYRLDTDNNDNENAPEYGVLAIAALIIIGILMFMTTGCGHPTENRPVVQARTVQVPADQVTITKTTKSFVPAYTSQIRSETQVINTPVPLHTVQVQENKPTLQEPGVIIQKQ